MKIVTASNGKKSIKISKSEWQQIGKKAGWPGWTTDAEMEIINRDYSDCSMMTYEQICNAIDLFSDKYMHHITILKELWSDIKKEQKYNNEDEISILKNKIKNEEEELLSWKLMIEKIGKALHNHGDMNKNLTMEQLKELIADTRFHYSSRAPYLPEYPFNDL